jgi:hypothetical protein
MLIWAFSWLFKCTLRKTTTAHTEKACIGDLVEVFGTQYSQWFVVRLLFQPHPCDFHMWPLNHTIQHSYNWRSEGKNKKASYQLHQGSRSVRYVRTRMKNISGGCCILTKFYRIWGFHTGAHKHSSLLGYYTMSTENLPLNLAQHPTRLCTSSVSFICHVFRLMLAAYASSMWR